MVKKLSEVQVLVNSAWLQVKVPGMVDLLQTKSALRVGGRMLNIKGKLYGTNSYICCIYMPYIPFVAAHKLQGKLIHQSMQLNKNSIASHGKFCI